MHWYDLFPRSLCNTSIGKLQEILQRLRQRVQAKFPTSSDAAKNFNDLPLLGAQPSMAGTLDQIVINAKPETSTPPVNADVPPSVGPSTPSSVTDGVMASMVQSPNYFTEDGMNAFWSEPNLKLFQDNNGGGIPVPLADRQGFQQSLPEGLSNAPMDSFMPIFPQANAEAGQWHQFLDRLGVWE